MDRAPPTRLRRMFETSEWADLTISTATKDFRVHKSVVCPASPFFHAACTRDFQEAKTGRIELEENENVVKALLQEIYEIDADLTCDRSHVLDDALLRDKIVEMITLWVAADKYQIKGLGKKPLVATWGVMADLKSIAILTELGSWLFSDDVPDDNFMLSRVTVWTARRINDVLTCETAWLTLHSNQRYLKDVMRCLRSAIPGK